MYVRMYLKKKNTKGVRTDEHPLAAVDDHVHANARRSLRNWPKMPFHACGSVVLPVARSREGRLASVGRSVGQVAVRAESNYPKLNKELLRRDDPRRCLLADETRARARARASCETGCNGVQRAAVSPAFPSH
jgi:hypothetical protein